MRAFADVSDLEALIGRTVDDAQGTALLEAASGHLRHVIGQDVFPRTTSTYTGYPTSGREDLPQWPVLTVDAVERDGSPISYTYRPGYILVDGDDPIDVTFTWGLAQAPDELKRLTCVLASQAFQILEAAGALTSGGLSSIAIDDFRAAFDTGGAASGIALTPNVEESIRCRYGRGDVYQPGTS